MVDRSIPMPICFASKYFKKMSTVKMLDVTNSMIVFLQKNQKVKR